MVTEEDMRKIVKETVQEAFTSLGIDIHQLQEMQADMYFLRHFRKSREEMLNKLSTKILLIIATGGVYLLWEAFKNKLNG